MRRVARIDANQPSIVKALRDCGCSVEPRQARLGDGIPDLLVGYRGANFLLEVKNPEQPPSARRLTPDEQQWHQAWTGQVAVVETVEEALRAVGVLSCARDQPPQPG